MNAFGSKPVPARAGVGLKPEHYRDILAATPDNPGSLGIAII